MLPTDGPDDGTHSLLHSPTSSAWSGLRRVISEMPELGESAGTSQPAAPSALDEREEELRKENLEKKKGDLGDGQKVFMLARNEYLASREML